MKFSTSELLEVIESGNWELKVHTSASQFCIEVVDSSKCNTLLQQAMLSEASGVWHGNKALFYHLPEDYVVLGELVFMLCCIFGEDYSKHIHWSV